MNLFFYLLVLACLFILGTIFGSFLAVVILRSMRNESWVHGSSHCDSCHKKIAWYDNIPLLSFLILGGRCRYCSTKIHPVHFLVELLTGALFVWWFIGFSAFFQLTTHPFVILQPLFWLVVAVVLIIIFFVDLLYYIIPNWAVFFLTVLTLFYRLILIYFGPMKGADFAHTLAVTAGITALIAFLWFITKGRGMGFGDVKLVVPLGLLLGWPNALIAIFLAFISGSIVGLILIVLKIRKFKQIIPFGPFLIFGSFTSLIFGNVLYEWYWSLLR